MPAGSISGIPSITVEAFDRNVRPGWPAETGLSEHS
jgi:hypothetical protein